MKQGAMRQLWVGLCLTAGLWLSGCGGGGGDTTPTPAPVGKVSGTAVASDDSSPLANAKVSVAGMSTRTAADGSFTIDAVPAADRQVLSIEADGFVDGKLPVPVAGTRLRVPRPAWCAPPRRRRSTRLQPPPSLRPTPPRRSIWPPTASSTPAAVQPPQAR